MITHLSAVSYTHLIGNIVCDLAPNTKRNYRERYKYEQYASLNKLRQPNMKKGRRQKIEKGRKPVKLRLSG